MTGTVVLGVEVFCKTDLMTGHKDSLQVQRLDELLPWNWKKAKAADNLAAQLTFHDGAQGHRQKSELTAALTGRVL